MGSSIDDLKGLYDCDVKNAKKNIFRIKNNINSIYNERYTFIEKDRKQKLNYLRNYGKMLEVYSTFDLQLIGCAIADLFTLYKGEPYNFLIDYEEISDNIFIYKAYVQSDINKRKKSYLQIRLFEVEKNIKFYNFFVGMDELIEHDFIKRYPFIKKFIDYVVNFRLDNKIISVDYKTIDKLLREFVLLHKEEIDSIHQNVKDEYKDVYDATLKLILAKMPDEK